MNLAEQIRSMNDEPRRRYVALLHVFDQSNFEHLQLLDKLRITLGLTPEQVGKDFGIICEVRRLSGSLDKQEGMELNAKMIEANKVVSYHFAELQAYNEKWKADHVRLAENASCAHSHFMAARDNKLTATKRLKEIAKEFPDLVQPLGDDDSAVLRHDWRNAMPVNLTPEHLRQPPSSDFKAAQDKATENWRAMTAARQNQANIQISNERQANMNSNANTNTNEDTQRQQYFDSKLAGYRASGLSEAVAEFAVDLEKNRRGIQASPPQQPGQSRGQ